MYFQMGWILIGNVGALARTKRIPPTYLSHFFFQLDSGKQIVQIKDHEHSLINCMFVYVKRAEINFIDYINIMPEVERIENIPFFILPRRANQLEDIP